MKKIVTQLILVIISVGCIGTAVNMFFGPHHIASGGVSGISLLAESAFGINRAIVVLVLNGVLLVLALIFLGKQAFFKTLLGSLLLPLALATIPEIMVTEDRLLSVIFGSVIFASGVSILYRIGASSGGTTIPPLIFKKYFGLNTSVGLLFTDAVIVVFNIFVFGVEEFLFAILAIVMISRIMNFIETGLKKRKAILIISEKHEAIRGDILTKLKRGVTQIPISGGYDETKGKMLLVAIDNREYRALMEVVDRYDKKAFVLAYDASEVHGLGFSYQPIV